MNYIISQKQIEFLNKILFDCNIPVQAYDNTVKLLAHLPMVEEPVKKEETKAEDAINTKEEK